MKKLKKVMALGLIAASLAGFGLVGRSVDACWITSGGIKMTDCRSTSCSTSFFYRKPPKPRCECLCHSAHKNEPVPCYCDCSSLN